MEHKYEITMYAPIGKRYGTLWFAENQTKITGILDVLKNKNTFQGTIDGHGEITFHGCIISLLYSFSYHAEGRITASNIDLDVIGERHTFRITGKEINL